MMEAGKREALKAAGFRVGDAGDFLGLSDAERRLVELRVSLARSVRRFREAGGLSQRQLAARIGSSQSRVAKIESASPDVSLDLMFRGLFAAGGDLPAVARASESAAAPPASEARWAPRVEAGARKVKRRTKAST